MGTAQGAVQAVLATVLMLAGSGRGASFGHARGAAFWIVLLALVGALIGCGIVVDRRRTARPLALVAPVTARRIVLLVAVSVPLVAYGGLGLLAMSRPGGDPLGAFVCIFLAGMLVAVPYAFVTLDRVVGPAWVLVRSLLRATARKRWARHEVIEADGTRVLVADERGERFYARSEQPLEPGVVFLRLEPLAEPGEPYRHAHVRATVEAHETLSERRGRARDVGTAALALLSGLAWAAVPFAPILGWALTH